MARGKGATLGFIGDGEVRVKATNAILNDQLEAADGNLRFILPITKEHWSEGIQLVADFARKNDVPYEVVLDDTTAKMKDVKEYIADSVKEYKVARIPHKIVNLLEKSGNGKLVVLWADEEDEAGVAFEKAYEAGVKTYDLCSGFDEVNYDDDDGKKDEEEDDEPEPGEKAADVVDLVYTRKQLEAKDLDELKSIAAARKIELPPRVRTPRYIDAILDWQKDNAGVDTDTGEKTSKAKDDDEEDEKPRRSRRQARDEEEDDEEEDDEEEDDVEIPSEDEEDIELPSDDAEETGVRGETRPYIGFQLVGNCAGCGGPIFAKSDSPDEIDTEWFHAKGCELK